MRSLEVINDFAACAYSIPQLQKEDLHCLYDAPATPDAPMAILGPGTGFGVAALVPTESGPHIITGEGGHVSFAPTDEREIEVLRVLLARQDHVSVENLVSGTGLVTLYQTLAQLDGVSPQDYSAGDISARGISGEDALCRETLERFCAMFGSVAGDKALTYGAQGGIYLGGGIAPRLVEFLPRTQFLARLHHKGPMSDYVKKIPVQVITHKTAALLGACAWLTRRLARDRQNSAK
jgi:glucokinase